MFCQRLIKPKRLYFDFVGNTVFCVFSFNVIFFVEILNYIKIEFRRYFHKKKMSRKVRNSRLTADMFGYLLSCSLFFKKKPQKYLKSRDL